MDYEKNQYNILTIYFYFCDCAGYTWGRQSVTWVIFLLKDDINLNIISENEDYY